jgi:hypothetical protein
LHNGQVSGTKPATDDGAPVSRNERRNEMKAGRKEMKAGKKK